jgi:DNA-binding NarL/FixJ family response regulator
VIADNRLVRETFAQKLSELPDLRVVVAAPTVDSALLSHAQPEVVLLDAGMRDESSLRLAVSVKKEFPESKVIVMDRLPVHEGIAEFVNAGVAGFILKDATFEDFVGTIRTVAKGACVLPPQMIGTLFSQIARESVGRRHAPASGPVRLTAREREVIELISAGLSNREIAERLEIASHTVKSHVRKVMQKLTLHTRLQIAAYSHRQGPD